MLVLTKERLENVNVLGRGLENELHLYIYEIHYRKLF